MWKMVYAMLLAMSSDLRCVIDCGVWKHSLPSCTVEPKGGRSTVADLEPPRKIKHVCTWLNTKMNENALSMRHWSFQMRPCPVFKFLQWLDDHERSETYLAAILQTNAPGHTPAKHQPKSSHVCTKSTPGTPAATQNEGMDVARNHACHTQAPRRPGRPAGTKCATRPAHRKALMVSSVGLLS